MLRLVSGKYKGRKLVVPEGMGVRPTTERMRERIFSMLAHTRYPDLHQARVADIFAGSGSLGLEALSRGADHVTFVELNKRHMDIIGKNITTLKANAQTTLIKASGAILPKSIQPFDFIFMDPPYYKSLINQTISSITEQGWAHDQTVIIAEMGHDEILECSAPWQQLDERSQGKQKIIFLKQGF